MGNKANARIKEKEPRKKPHEHFTAGKTGYIPQSAGQNPYKMRKES